MRMRIRDAGMAMAMAMAMGMMMAMMMMAMAMGWVMGWTTCGEIIGECVPTTGVEIILLYQLLPYWRWFMFTVQ